MGEIKKQNEDKKDFLDLQHQISVARIESYGLDKLIKDRKSFITHKDRPLDGIGFLANDQLFINEKDLKTFDDNFTDNTYENNNVMQQHTEMVEMQQIKSLTEVSPSAQAPLDKIQQICQQCHQLDDGKVDTDDGQFYCNECWKQFTSSS
eukprot:468543_1